MRNRMESTFEGLALIVVAILISVGQASAQAPETILINGKVVTVDAQFSVRQALAVRDGKILSVGSTSEIRSWPLPPPASSIFRADVIPG